ncbi:MAG TPA: alpha/beta fold hydrolase [Candidatus Saccharimonadales bacterium]|nr:alpha/beta fold hydrolase [Candidatus Saccharimonadales bacterium]
MLDLEGSIESQSAEPFRPRRFLRNGHMQTIVGNFLPRESGLPAAEDWLIEVEPDIRVLCHCHWQPQWETRPAVVIVHGLEGSSDSQYVIGNGSKAWAAGMNVIRMNMRTCGGTGHLSRTLYHSGLSNDVAAVIRHLIGRGIQRIGAVGYSMGGNLVLKMAGEWGGEAPSQLKVVATVSPASDLAASADALHEPANRVYEWRFLRSLMHRYREKISLFPEIYKPAPRSPRSLREFDDIITAPYSGFTGAQDYYTRAASARVVDKIACPALVIHSTDDPFVRMMPETRAKLLANPRVTLLETAHGGHCAFLASPQDYDGRWAERQIVRFFLRNGMA